MTRSRVLVFLSIALFVGVASAIGSHPATDRPVRADDRVAWVGKCLADFQAIRVGITRAEIEKRLRLDCGLQSSENVRYCHPECGHFKIVVKFAVKRNPKDQGRVVPSPDDRATEVSKPTIEPMVFD